MKMSPSAATAAEDKGAALFGWKSADIESSHHVKHAKH